MYNYKESIVSDILDYIKLECITVTEENREEIEEQLNDELWTNDSITGNASGSYTFNSNVAREYVLDNMDLCTDMLKEFCVENDEIAKHFLNGDYEWFDVYIRCYLLGECIALALNKLIDGD